MFGRTRRRDRTPPRPSQTRPPNISDAQVCVHVGWGSSGAVDSLDVRPRGPTGFVGECELIVGVGVKGMAPEAVRRPGWQITCAPACGFSVRDFDRAELVRVMQVQMSRSHQQGIGESEVVAMAKPA